MLNQEYYWRTEPANICAILRLDLSIFDVLPDSSRKLLVSSSNPTSGALVV